MECIEPVEFGKAAASGGGGCIEVGFHQAGAGHPDCGQVHVRNSRFPHRVVLVPLGTWKQLTAEAQAHAHLDLNVWFPQARYGDFADTFTEQERQAFEHGLGQGESQLVGPST